MACWEESKTGDGRLWAGLSKRCPEVPLKNNLGGGLSSRTKLVASEAWMARQCVGNREAEGGEHWDFGFLSCPGRT